MKPVLTILDDPFVETVHIRARPHDPGNVPQLCGSVGKGASVSAPWGWWGPEGKGWDWVCKACVKVWKENHGGHL